MGALPELRYPERRAGAAIAILALVLLAGGMASPARADDVDWCAPVVVRPDQRLASPSACRFAFEPGEIARRADVVFLSGETVVATPVAPPHDLACFGPATVSRFAEYVDDVNGRRPAGRPPITWILFVRTDLVMDTWAALPGFRTSFLARTSKPWRSVEEFFTKDRSGACPVGGCVFREGWVGKSDCDGDCLRERIAKAGPEGAAERAVYYLNHRDHPVYWPSGAIARLDDAAYRSWLVAELARVRERSHVSMLLLNHKLSQYLPKERRGGLAIGGPGHRDVAEMRRSQDGWTAEPDGYGYPEYVAGWHALAGDLAAAGVPFAVHLGRSLWNSPKHYDEPSSPGVDEAALLREVAEERATLVILDSDGVRREAERVAERLRGLGRRTLVVDSNCGYAKRGE